MEFETKLFQFMSQIIYKLNQLSSMNLQVVHMFYYKPSAAKVTFGLFFHRDKNEAMQKQQSPRPLRKSRGQDKHTQQVQNILVV